MQVIRVDEATGIGSEDAVITVWYFGGGDLVEEGEPVAGLMAEKVQFDVLAPTKGRLAIFKAVDDLVRVGDAIGAIE